MRKYERRNFNLQDSPLKGIFIYIIFSVVIQSFDLFFIRKVSARIFCHVHWVPVPYLPQRNTLYFKNLINYSFDTQFEDLHTKVQFAVTILFVFYFDILHGFVLHLHISPGILFIKSLIVQQYSKSSTWKS